MVELDTANYRFGGGASIGGGYFSLLGDGSEYLNNHASFNIGFVFSYGKVFYDFEMMISNAKAIKNYNNPSYIVNQDSMNQIFSFNNTLGYAILDNRKLCIYPFLGISANQLTEFRIDRNDSDGPTKLGYIAGIQINYKFSSSFGKTYMGDFVIGTRLNLLILPDYAGLNMSYLNISLYFRFHIRSYQKLY